MKGEEAFLIFVFFVVIATVEHIDSHLIDLTNGMEPQSLLFRLGTTFFVTDLDDVSDQGIKLQ